MPATRSRARNRARLATQDTQPQLPTSWDPSEQPTEPDLGQNEPPDRPESGLELADDDDMPPLVDAQMSTASSDMPPLMEAPAYSFDNQKPTYFLPPLPESPMKTAHSGVFPLRPGSPSAEPPKPSHHRKRPDNHIPRPPNAFILFRASFIKSHLIPGTIEQNHTTLSRIAGICWRDMKHEEKETWREMARKAMEDHKKRYPLYRYNPRDGRGSGSSGDPSSSAGGKIGRIKRKVKEIAGPPLDPERCKEIARMLVQGKKGDELEDAVRKFDGRRDVKPAIEARFDDPMTAGNFNALTRKRAASLPAKKDKDGSRKDKEIRTASPEKEASPQVTSHRKSSSVSVSSTPTLSSSASTGSLPKVKDEVHDSARPPSTPKAASHTWSHSVSNVSTSCPSRFSCLSLGYLYIIPIRLRFRIWILFLLRPF
ncbi:hypothetical protein SISNIDRAFT_438143, partial [Sistotremastrum niveocremeum HHB9708]